MTTIQSNRPSGAAAGGGEGIEEPFTDSPTLKPTSNGGWIAVSKIDLRTIASIPGPRKHSALAVWIALLGFSNFKRSVRFSLDHATLGKHADLGRRTVGFCLADLRKVKLLTYTAPRLENGRQSISTFTIRPTVKPFNLSPCAEDAHGKPCADDDTLQLRSNKPRESLEDSPNGKEKVAGTSYIGGLEPADAGPAPEKKPERKVGFM